MKKLYITIVILITSFVITNGINAGWVHKLSGYNVSTIAIANNGDLYTGGHDPLTVSRIWKSTDIGLSWELIRVGAADPIFGFAFDNLDYIYVAQFSVGLLKSTNHGQSFSTISKSVHFNNYNVNGVACGNGGNVFVVTTGGFYRSTNYGESFTRTDLHGLLCKSLLVDLEFPNTVFVGVSDATGADNGLYKSTDGGLTFGSNSLPGESVYLLFQGENYDIFKFTIAEPHIFEKSTDKGVSWIQLGNLPGFVLSMTDFSFHGNLRDYYISTTEGIYLSTDGGFTFNLNSNFTNSTGLLNVKNPNIHLTFAGVIANQFSGLWMYTNAIILNTSNTSTELSDFHLNQNYPNPFNSKTKISFELRNYSETLTLKFYSVSGIEVTQRKFHYMTPGYYSIDFDATDLPSGVYFYKLISGDQEQVRKMILLR